MKTTLLLSVLTFITINTNAQIIYTDIDDGVPSGIDFNQDGINEFDILEPFIPDEPVGQVLEYFFNENNDIHAIDDADNNNIPDCVDLGFTIGATSKWFTFGDAYINGFDGFNPTVTINEDEYLGMKFNFDPEDTNVYYGWVRISVDELGNVTYKDYAYESTPNTAIDAGDKPALSVNDVNLSNNFKIYPNPATNLVSIDYKFKTNNFEIIINDMFGKVVSQKLLLNGDKTVNVSNLNTGVYMLTLIEDGVKVGFKKLILSN